MAFTQDAEETEASSEQRQSRQAGRRTYVMWRVVTRTTVSAAR